MKKEFDNYSIHGTFIVKRSPSSVFNSRVAATEDLRKSMKKNLDILSKWVKESELIMPRPQRSKTCL
jgi:hypothetical protein